MNRCIHPLDLIDDAKAGVLKVPVALLTVFPHFPDFPLLHSRRGRCCPKHVTKRTAGPRTSQEHPLAKYHVHPNKITLDEPIDWRSY